MVLLTRAEFERCAIAGGLLSNEQLAEAISAMRWASGDEPDPQPAGEGAGEAEQLAAWLVERGMLNLWQAKQLLEGQTRFHLGPYRIVDSLGSGGMGQVFRARHTETGLEVAIKVLPRDKSTPEAVASFAREVRAQASLNHENLVKAVDAGYDGKVYYLVSEYVPGSDLRKLVRHIGPLDMQAAACIISQVAKGLAHAHQRGLIHRDVKPGNVLVTPDGRAKLSDLGLAGPLGEEADSDPRHGKIVGTPDYLSPDHIKAPWSPTPAWDVYSLGCTLYYAVTSKVPFPGGTTADKARAHCQMRPLDPRRLNPSLSSGFVDVLADMMAKEAAERIQSAEQVVERLAPWAGATVSIPAASLKAASLQNHGAAGILVPASRNRPIPPAEDAANMADTADGMQISAASFASPSGGAGAESGRDGAKPLESFDDGTGDAGQDSQTTRSMAASDEPTFSRLSIGDLDVFHLPQDENAHLLDIFRASRRYSRDRIIAMLLVILTPLAALGLFFSFLELISRLF